jgi:hypothetical protein
MEHTGPEATTGTSPFSGLSDPIISITPTAHAQLVALRDN